MKTVRDVLEKIGATRFGKPGINSEKLKEAKGEVVYAVGYKSSAHWLAKYGKKHVMVGSVWDATVFDTREKLNKAIDEMNKKFDGQDYKVGSCVIAHAIHTSHRAHNTHVAPYGEVDKHDNHSINGERK